MSKDHVTGTPTVFINGKEYTNPQEAATAVLAATK
jgi:protein-disulfide isomerase